MFYYASRRRDKREKNFGGTFGGGYGLAFAFPYGTSEDVPIEDFSTTVRGIPVKARLGIKFGNESSSLVFLSAQKTFFIDPIENLPDFGTGLGMIFSHRENLYHLIEIGAKPTRDKEPCSSLLWAKVYFSDLLYLN